jgi:hypothetical protein
MDQHVENVKFFVDNKIPNDLLPMLITKVDALQDNLRKLVMLAVLLETAESLLGDCPWGQFRSTLSGIFGALGLSVFERK